MIMDKGKLRVKIYESAESNESLKSAVLTKKLSEPQISEIKGLE
jgi:hypothetical protein